MAFTSRAEINYVNRTIGLAWLYVREGRRSDTEKAVAIVEALDCTCEESLKLKENALLLLKDQQDKANKTGIYSIGYALRHC